VHSPCTPVAVQHFDTRCDAAESTEMSAAFVSMQQNPVLRFSNGSANILATKEA